MPSPTFDLFRDAIMRRLQITCRYNGLVREVCPHCVGFGPDGREHALVFQFAGRSSKPLPAGGEWRCLDLARVRDAAMREGAWFSDGRYGPGQTCVSRVVTEIEQLARSSPVR